MLRGNNLPARCETIIAYQGRIFREKKQQQQITSGN